MICRVEVVHVAVSLIWVGPEFGRGKWVSFWICLVEAHPSGEIV